MFIGELVRSLSFFSNLAEAPQERHHRAFAPVLRKYDGQWTKVAKCFFAEI